MYISWTYFILSLTVLGVGARWLDVCDHTQRVCGVYPLNDGDQGIIQSFLSANGPLADGYTLLISPYRKACTDEDCITIHNGTDDTSPINYWRLPVTVIPLEGLTFRSAYRDVPVQFIQDEFTALRAPDVAKCATFFFSGNRVTIQDMVFNITDACREQSSGSITELSSVVVEGELLRESKFERLQTIGNETTLLIFPNVKNTKSIVFDGLDIRQVTKVVIADGSGAVTVQDSEIDAYGADLNLTGSFRNISVFVPYTILQRGLVESKVIVETESHSTLLIILIALAVTVGAALIANCVLVVVNRVQYPDHPSWVTSEYVRQKSADAKKKKDESTKVLTDHLQEKES